MSISAAADERVARALIHLQEAQTQLELAISQLSTLRDIGPTWSKASKLYDQVHALWYRVQRLPEGRRHITTDSEPSP